MNGEKSGTQKLASAGRHRTLSSAAAFVVVGGVSLVAMVWRPIESSVLLALVGSVLTVLVLRSRRSDHFRRAIWLGAAAAIWAVLIFYWTSALINMEPDVVIDHG